jgi:hypothetical protein
MRVIERRDRPRFLLELRAVFGIQFLEGNKAIEPRVAGLPDFAHAAGAERREHFVRAESSSSGKDHVSVSSFRDAPIVGGRRTSVCYALLIDRQRRTDDLHRVPHGGGLLPLVLTLLSRCRDRG